MASKKQDLTDMMLRLANQMDIMAAAMLDYSRSEGDEWHIHATEAQCAASQIRQWVEVIEGEA